MAESEVAQPPALLERFKSRWERAVLLPGETDLTSSAIRELTSYFPSLPPREIPERFLKSEKLFADHWHHQGVNPRSEESLTRFYNETTLEIFELMHYHSVKWDDGPLNYVCALDLAGRTGCRSYLDYGSGVGSGGLLFAREGLPVALCDISTPLLNFAKWRFASRGLEARFIDLKQAFPSEPVDLITCFEVLEHVRNPLALLRKLHTYLNDGGFLIVTTPFWKDEERPMHIVHNARLTRRFRGQGFQIRWDLRKPIRDALHDPLFVLQKVHRSRFKNALLETYDSYIPEPVRVGLHRFVKPTA